MIPRQSDRRIVPLRMSSLIRSKPSNVGEGKASGPSRDTVVPSTALSGESSVLRRLDRIKDRAEQHPQEVFNNLFSLLTPELLRLAFGRLKRNKAPGVNEVTVEDYAADLENNLHDLLQRLHCGSYRPKPSLRRDIPKGNGKTRPLGIAAVEEKLVQRAVVMILERIYEADFCDTSYGFRPGRSCHMALAQLGKVIATKKVNWISDADIKGFFDNVCHDKLHELLCKRIADPRMLQLIERFLKAGVMIEGRREETNDGVPQGSVLSPLLANVYLHYVLDLWFEHDVKPRLRGAAYLVRYADDFICAFECESDARGFQEVLVQRLGDFSLELALEKSKLLRFGRFAERESARLGEGRPGVFDFLGFTHYCGLSRAGKFKLKRRTSKKKLKGKLRDFQDWLRSQLTVPLREVWPLVNAKLSGHFQYYNVNDNWESLELFRRHVSRLCFRWMRRRSQKGKTLSWPNYYAFLSVHPLASPKQITDLIAMAP